MMLNSLKNAFKTYAQQYCTGDPVYDRNVTLKIKHCLCVSQLCGDIAKAERFSEAEQTMAKAIGLFHDIGRFEQYQKFQTFSDYRSVNHGMLGVQVLKISFDLSGLSSDQQKLLFKTTECHNGVTIPADEDQHFLRFLKLVRDADKIDIFGLSYNYFCERTENNKNETLELHVNNGTEISDKIYDRIINGNLAMMQDIQTLNDFKALQLSWIFDINYQHSFELIAQRQLLTKIFETLPKNHWRGRRVYEKANEFLEQHLSLPSLTATA